MSAAPTFVLTVSDAFTSERFERVRSFVGADASGSFGILARHAHCVAVLRYGLARFVDLDGRWRYLALPGGVLHFRGQVLNLMAERYFLGERRADMVERLAQAMAREDSELRTMRARLDEIERTLMRRLGTLSARDGSRP